MRINHNIAALNTYNKLAANQANTSKSLEKLSSGLKINRAGDDAAGLAISEKMRGQIRGLDQAGRNAQDGISLIQTAEGALNETHSILQRVRELAVQASNDTLQPEDRAAIGTEVKQLTTELTRIADNTKFNGKALLDGSFGIQADNSAAGSGVQVASLTNVSGITNIDVSGAKASTTYTLTTTGLGKYTITDAAGTGTQNLTLTDGSAGVLNFDKFGISITIDGSKTAAQIVALTAGTAGAGTIKTTADAGAMLQIGADANQSMAITIGNMDASGLGVDALKVDSFANANLAITSTNDAIALVSTQRANLGAAQNRLEHTINNLGTSSENLTASESRIRDVDMAKEMMEFTKNNILAQAAQSMLAQANQQPQGVLQLLR